MDLVFDVIITILLIICIGLLFLVLKKKNNQETDRLFDSQEKIASGVAQLKGDLQQQSNALYGAVRDEFSKSRLENNAQQSEQRKELTAQMSDMAKKIEKMNTDNYAFNIRMSEMISKNLLEMRKGNEEKLEQMRITVDEKPVMQYTILEITEDGYILLDNKQIGIYKVEPIIIGSVF